MLRYSASTQDLFPWTRPHEIAPGHLIVRALTSPAEWECSCGARSDREDDTYKLHWIDVVLADLN